MQNATKTWSEEDYRAAFDVLRAELEEFSYDGLVQLYEDLQQQKVLRGTWAGCVISYKRGAAGSARRDRNGAARNAFTVMWDTGVITESEVLAVVEREMARRGIAVVQRPKPAEVALAATA